MSEDDGFKEIRRLDKQIEFLERFLRPGPPLGLKHETAERELEELRNRRDLLKEIWFSLYDP